MCGYVLEHSCTESVYNVSGSELRLKAVEMRARLSWERSAAILSSLRHFRMASLLHMCPLQFWLKSQVPWTAWTLGCLSIAVSRGCIEALRPWRKDLFSRGGSPGLGDVTYRGHDGRIDPHSVPPWDLEKGGVKSSFTATT